MSTYEDIGYTERLTWKQRKALRLANARDRELTNIKQLLEGGDNDLQEYRSDRSADVERGAGSGGSLHRHADRQEEKADPARIQSEYAKGRIARAGWGVYCD